MGRRSTKADARATAAPSHAPEQRRLPLTLQQQTMLQQASNEVQRVQAQAQLVLSGVLAAAGIAQARIVEAKLDDAAPYLLVQVLSDA